MPERTDERIETARDLLEAQLPVRPTPGNVELYESGGELRARPAEGFAEAAGYTGDGVTLSETVGESAAEGVSQISAEATGPVSDATLSELSGRVQDAWRINVGDRATLNFRDGLGALSFRGSQEREQFVDLLGDLSDSQLQETTVSDLGDAPDIAENLQESQQRRTLRELARDALPDVVDNPDEYGVDARADGQIVLQDRDTGRTETVDVSSPGEVGTAIDAAAGELAPEAEGPGGGPRAGSSGGDSLTGAAAAVVLAIVGIALAWVGGD